MTNLFFSVAGLLLSAAALAQAPGQVTSNDLANCPEEVKKAHLEFVQKLSIWNARVSLSAVRTRDEDLMDSALGATGRGKQYLETTDYGLVQYCNALKSVQDEVAKSGK